MKWLWRDAIAVLKYWKGAYKEGRNNFLQKQAVRWEANLVLN